MNRIIIEQRRVKIRNQEHEQFEILISDDYDQGVVSIKDICQNKEHLNKFYDNQLNLIRDLLKVYYQDGYGDSITSIFDRLTHDEISMRVDDTYYDYEELKDIIKQVESECI